jgi:hypothetical protein
MLCAFHISPLRSTRSTHCIFLDSIVLIFGEVHKLLSSSFVNHQEPGQLSWYIDRLRLDGRGSIPSKGKAFFSTPQRPDRFWGPLNLLFNGYRGTLSPGVKRPERETDHSPPTNAEVKNGGDIHPLPHTSS